MGIFPDHASDKIGKNIQYRRLAPAYEVKSLTSQAIITKSQPSA